MRLHANLTFNGTVRTALAKLWAERFGMLSDPFGVPWMIDCEEGHA